MGAQAIAFRLPMASWPRAVFETDFGFRGGRLVIDEQPALEVESKAALLAGRSFVYEGAEVLVRLEEDELGVLVDGAPAVREDRISATPSRSVWIHAVIALFASFFGFAASYLYLERARVGADPWALKMAIHMAGWHLLLTLTLFPASVWGQRPGIRAVQGVSVVFFLIHLGIALANVGATGTEAGEGPWVALLNTASGVGFLAGVIYGQWAYRDMDPLRRLIRPEQGRV